MAPESLESRAGITAKTNGEGPLQTLALGSGVLGRPLVRSVEVRLAIGVAAFTSLTALGAFVRIPLPFTPVPITLQTFFVLSAGVALGRRAGALSQGLYLALGCLGAPYFAGGESGLAYLAGPTGGYLLGFPLAAWLVGALAGAGSERRPLGVVGSLLVASAVIFVSGAGWLAVWGGYTVGAALAVGVLPFLPGLVVKVLLIAGAEGLLRERLDRLFPGRRDSGSPNPSTARGCSP